MRRKYKADAKKRFSYLVTALLIGFAMGLLAKLVDNPRVTGIVPVFDDLGGRLGIWIFTATLLAVFCNSPGMAAIRTFIYFMSFLFTYYAYTVLFLGFFQKARSFSGDYVRLYLRSVHSSYGLPVERDGFPIS